MRDYLDEVAKVRRLAPKEQLQWVCDGGNFQNDGMVEDRLRLVLVRTRLLFSELKSGTVNSWAKKPEPRLRRSTLLLVKMRNKLTAKTKPVQNDELADPAGLRIFNGHLPWSRAIASLDEKQPFTAGDTPAGLHPWLHAVAAQCLADAAVTLQQATLLAAGVRDRLRHEIPEVRAPMVDRILCKFLPLLRVTTPTATTLYVDVHNEAAVSLTLTEVAKAAAPVAASADPPSPPAASAQPPSDPTRPCSSTATTAGGPSAFDIFGRVCRLVPREGAVLHVIATRSRGCNPFQVFETNNPDARRPPQRRRLRLQTPAAQRVRPCAATARRAAAAAGDVNDAERRHGSVGRRQVFDVSDAELCDTATATAEAFGSTDVVVASSTLTVDDDTAEGRRPFMSLLNTQRTDYWSTGFAATAGSVKSSSRYWAKPFADVVEGAVRAPDPARRPTAMADTDHLRRPYAQTTFADMLRSVELLCVLLPSGLPRHVPHHGTCMPDFDTADSDLVDDDVVVASAASSVKTAWRRPGRVPLHNKYPTMAAAAKEFIDSNGTKAQVRRRNDTVTMSNGVTLRQLRDHLLSRVPELDTLSISTVARMLVAPNKGHRSARRYHGVVNARVPKKSNSRRDSKKGNKNHLCMSVMAYMLENGVDMQGCVDVWSVDDKAKLKVSSDCPCVSRYHQIRRFFMVGDAPEYKDHDFPTPGYHLCPSGYKELVQEPWQRDTQYYDKHGRPHLPVCREGPLKIVLRACKYQQSNAMSHANDLFRMYKGKPTSARKPVLMCYADGGPDWQVESQKTLYYYGRFFQKSGLDAFGMGSGGGGYSAFNPIERSWAPVSKQLSSVYLSDKLPGEDEAPIKQSGLTATQLANKEHVVFDSAMEHAAKLWNNNFSIGGHPVMAEVVPCAAKPTPFDDMDDFELWTRIASTHVGRKDKIRQRLTKLKVPATEERVKAMMDITNRMRFFTRHVDRRSEFMLFRKGPPSCCEWCKTHPRRKESEPFFDLIRRHGTYFTPQEDPGVPGSYKTYLQVKHHPTSLDFVPNKLMEAEFGPRNYPYRCQKKGCHWFFTSKADFDRHRGRAWCKASYARRDKPRRSRAVGAAADQRAERRQQGHRFKCAHPDCVAGQLNQSLTRQKRAAHWKASPAHKPPAKKAKQAKPRHLTPGRSLTRPAAVDASGTAASGTAASQVPLGLLFCPECMVLHALVVGKPS